MAKTIQYYIDKYGIESGTKRFNGMVATLAKREETYASHPYPRLTKEWFLWRYPVDGEERFRQHVNKSKQTESNFITRYGIEAGKKKFADTMAKKNTVALTIERHGDKGKKIIEERYARARKSMEARSDYQELIDRRTATLVAASKKNKGRKKLDVMVEKHGVEEGTRLYQAMICKQFAGPNRMSSPAKKILSYLIDKVDSTTMDNIYCDIDGKKEYWLSKNGKLFSYDFTYLNPKAILEYDGEFWHPAILSTKLHPVTKSPVITMWEHDKEKRKVAEENGFTYFVVRSDESELYQKTTIDNFIKFIKEQ